MKQITNWQSNYAKKMSESADIGKKISDKRVKRNDAYKRLQKEQQAEQKKQSESLKQMQQSYEKRINELSNQTVQDFKANMDNTINESEEEDDVFVSHAWEDKKDFVDEFVQALRMCGIKI